MSTCFCCGGASIGSKILKQVQAKLRQIEDLFPQTSTSFILSATGELLLQSNNNEQIKGRDVLTIMTKLKEAALRLGESLPSKEKECSVIHIKSQNQVFSLYEIGDHFLVFYTQMKRKESDRFDFQAADAKVRDICEEMKPFLPGHSQ